MKTIRFVKSKKYATLFASLGLILATSIIGFSLAGATDEVVDENGMTARDICLQQANQTFLNYLESKSTTYKLDDGTIINLPHYPEAIGEAEQVLANEKSICN